LWNLSEASELARILRIAHSTPDLVTIREAVRVLDANGLVMYPTESSYALGVNALRRIAVERLYKAKGRPMSKSIPVIVSDLKMWKKYAHFDRTAEILVRKFNPGPLTLVLRKKPLVPNVLTSSSIAARIPGHRVALALVREANYPITSTSANMSGEPPAYSLKSVPRSLRSEIDLILDAGTLERRKYSTIVDVTIRGKPVVTRKGAIPTLAITRTLAQGRNEK
jgi:L-threonylcarbamoyladenylate synthase